MSRTGKIARMAKRVRDELNERLREGAGGPEVLEWLNGLPEVQSLLAKQFEGKAVTPQNLSDWRTGGYEDWLETQARGEMVERVQAQAADLARTTPVTDGVSGLLAAELARMTVTMLREAPDSQERWERLRGLIKELKELRTADQRAVVTKLKQEEWNLTLVKHAEEKAEEARVREINRRCMQETMTRIEAGHRRVDEERLAVETELAKQRFASGANTRAQKERENEA